MSERRWHKTNDRTSQEYVDGVKEFLSIAANHRRESDGLIRCPCRDCLNTKWHSLTMIGTHLIKRGMAWSYNTWTFHGETNDVNRWRHMLQGTSRVETPVTDSLEADTVIFGDSVCNEDHSFEDNADRQILDEMFRCDDDSDDDNLENIGDGASDPCKWTNLFSNAEREVYPGCRKFSLLSAVIQMMHLKVEGRQSVKSFNQWLEFVKSILPEGEILPSSYYEAKKMLRELGFTVNKIHACKNDCVLFRKEFADLDRCPRCNESRWLMGTRNEKKKVPIKVLRHFPIIPRLQRLFISKKTASDMRWHRDGHVTDVNVMRHPSDSKAWKELDLQFPEFGSDPRNVRLGMATDGFNPFGNLSSTYSSWPVIMFPYNVPPWKCMKEPFMFLTLLIPGPKSPGKDIDVFLQPLVDELNELWTIGVKTNDVMSGQMFNLRAALLWTINDFPAYGDISGWSTKGFKACPVCNVNVSSAHNQSKFHYMGHRAFLPMNHPWRKNKSKFDGTVEKRAPPHELSNDEIMLQLSAYENVVLGKHGERSKRKRSNDGTNWYKKSVLFKLPYWEKLVLRHNLDVMHIEKNICESLVGTILNIKGKSKDTDKARETLREMNIRQELHLQMHGSRWIKPPALFALSSTGIKEFCKLLKDVKLPDGYSSNISSCLGQSNTVLRGMKSHDCHVFIQKILPIVLRGFLPDEIYGPICELSRFFRELCAKELRIDALMSMQESVIRTLCRLEMIFPPAFFDIMIHLAVHLPREARLCGPVQYRWMYPIERYLGLLKSMVKNKARPEGSIAEAYILRESLLFCSLYFNNNIDTRFNRLPRQHDGPEIEQQMGGLSVFSQRVRPLFASTYADVDEELNKMHWYVLNNCDEVEPYLR